MSVLGPVLGLEGQVLGPGLRLEGAVLAKHYIKDVSTPENQLTEYLQLINSPTFNPTDSTLPTLCHKFAAIKPLISCVLCSSATSADHAYKTPHYATNTR